VSAHTHLVVEPSSLRKLGCGLPNSAMLASREPNGSQTKFAREPNGSLPMAAREPNGSQTKFAREPNGSLTFLPENCN